MSYWKESAIDLMNSRYNSKLASILGITAEELNELEYEIETDENREGFIYNYRVEFDTEHSSKEILKKIKNLEQGQRVYIQPWELDYESDYDESEYDEPDNYDSDYESDYDGQFQFYAIVDEEDNSYSKFTEEMQNLESLNALNIPPPKIQSVLSRQIFIGIIGTMETYLCDAFANRVFNSEEYLKMFVATHPEFRSQKFTLQEIFTKYDDIEKIAWKVIMDTIYHNLPVVCNMYKKTFQIEFPEIKEIYQYVLMRHDLVHRNGKTKDGTLVIVDATMITEVLQKIRLFVAKIDAELAA